MKANAGGNLEPQHVYGRDQFIELLWHTLESQSVLQSGERRTGKTQILRKMLQQPKPGWKPIFRDLEKIHSALEFAELVYDKAAPGNNCSTPPSPTSTKPDCPKNSCSSGMKSPGCSTASAATKASLSPHRCSMPSAASASNTPHSASSSPVPSESTTSSPDFDSNRSP